MGRSSRPPTPLTHSFYLKTVLPILIPSFAAVAMPVISLFAVAIWNCVPAKWQIGTIVDRNIGWAMARDETWGRER